MNGREGTIQDYLYYAHVIINTQDLADNINDTDSPAWFSTLGLGNFNIDNIPNPYPDFYTLFGYNTNCLDD